MSRAREETLQNEQLVGIGTLAASTVHALGTPLSTLTVLLGEMRDSTDSADKREDIELMLGQIGRCKDTMKKLSLLAEQERDAPAVGAVQDLVDDLREHYAITTPLRPPHWNCAAHCAQKKLRCSLLLRHAMINLIDNAIDACRNMVTVDFSCHGSVLRIAIADDGPGIPPGILTRWGKPLSSGKESGLGIGVFLANSTIERLGGTVAIDTSDGDTAAAQVGAFHGHTRILVTLPLST